MRRSGGDGAEGLFPRGETVRRQAGSSPRTARVPNNQMLTRTWYELKSTGLQSNAAVTKGEKKHNLSQPKKACLGKSTAVGLPRVPDNQMLATWYLVRPKKTGLQFNAAVANEKKKQKHLSQPKKAWTPWQV